ncbi:N-acetylmuramoyl-L-alanine amidase [Paenibacillus oceani]|uniref:N-acetylmuramoyl-L-alanine amidase n=1 Tax=Paenibacillus oceani TaxID=2772510 RepID=A0A927C549_9BACL|nr:N-acetylmuramoyl-L-alanine amidase [Paenibacillus oceani]MBD2860994.1 N-acetylmuramoyl-L-alanine amidase [Paenibacillus oceani]
MRTGLLSLLLAAIALLAVPAQTFSAKTVVVDAGHGGQDPGAIGVNGLYEKSVNLDVAQKLKEQLIQRGYEVVMTRTADEYLSLAQRVEQTNAAQPSLFVSVHANSHPNPNVSGSLVLYYDSDYPQDSYPASEAMAKLSPESKKLANLVLKNIISETGFADKGIVPSAAYVIRMGQVPSILVETAFLSHSGDAARLSDSPVRQKLADGIAKGIAAYLPLPDLFPDLADHWAREAVLRLKDKGLVEGIFNRYEPDRAVTRAEWLALSDRLFKFADRLHAADAPDTGYPDTTTPKEQKKAETSLPTDQTEAAQAPSSPPELPESASQGQASPLAQTPPTWANRSAVQSETTAAPKPASRTPSPGQPQSFKDLPKSHWAYETFQNAVRLGYMNGYEDGTIRPDQPITRGEVTALLERMTADAGNSPPWTGPADFTDVPLKHWASGPIYRMKQQGIITGVTDKTFAPDKKMTRAEMAALMDRYVAAPK